jgi:hypothetical protein
MKKPKQKSSSKNSSKIVYFETHNKPTFDLSFRGLDKKTKTRLLAKWRRVINNATDEELDKAPVGGRRRRRK